MIPQCCPLRGFEFRKKAAVFEIPEKRPPADVAKRRHILGGGGLGCRCNLKRYLERQDALARALGVGHFIFFISEGRNCGIVFIIRQPRMGRRLAFIGSRTE